MNRVQKRISDIIQRMDKLEGRSDVGLPTKSSSSDSTGTQGVEKTAQVNPAAYGNNVAAQAGAGNTGTPKFSQQLENLIKKHGDKHGVSPALIRAVIQAESGGKVNAKSKAGAIGLMQLMPGTAKALGVNPRDPSQNIDGGVRYLKQMAGKFNSLDEILAAYNAGPGAVKKYGGVPPYRETQKYIRDVRGMLPGRRLDLSR